MAQNPWVTDFYHQIASAKVSNAIVEVMTGRFPVDSDRYIALLNKNPSYVFPLLAALLWKNSDEFRMVVHKKSVVWNTAEL